MSQKLPPSRTAPQFVIRFPDEDMRDRIREEAEKNGRSMNAEIVHRLERSLPPIGVGGFEKGSAADLKELHRIETTNELIIKIKEVSALQEKILQVQNEAIESLARRIEGSTRKPAAPQKKHDS